MMYAIKALGFTSLIFMAMSASGSGELEKKLELLSVPDDKVTPLVENDSLHVVNTRYSSLNKRHEVSFLGANNFNADSHIYTRQAGLAYRFHFNQKWSAGLRRSEYFNEMTDAGKRLFDEQRILPDVDYAKSSQEIFASYNTIYGKLRFSKNSVVYFDQYVSLGYGTVDLASTEENLYSLDLGFAFWMGKNMSARLGIKNEFYVQNERLGDRDVRNAMGYVSLGYLFGGRSL